MRPLSAELKRSLGDAASEHEQNRDAAKEYLLARGIGHALAVRFRLGVVSDQSTNNPDMAGRLCIPSIGIDGSIYNLRFRSMNDEVPKYMGLPGHEVRLFNIRALAEAGDAIHITEGELDAVVLNGCGLAAVGVCGANAWKRHHSRMFSGFHRAYVWGDGDDAGRKFASTVTQSLITAVRVDLPSGCDVNDLYLAEGEEGIRSRVT